MNERRQNKAKFLMGVQLSDLDRQWQGLLYRAERIEFKAIELQLETLEDLVSDIRDEIVKNRPNKKLLRVVERKISEVEFAIKKIESLLSQKNQKAR